MTKKKQVVFLQLNTTGPINEWETITADFHQWVVLNNNLFAVVEDSHGCVLLMAHTQITFKQ